MKTRALGTKLIVDDVPVGGLTSINGIDVTRDTVDLSSLDNEDGFREFDVTLATVNDVTASGFLDGDNAGQQKCMDLLESGELVDCKIVFPEKIKTGGLEWRFKAMVSRFSTGAELEDGVKFDATLKPSGKPHLGAPEAASGGEESGGGNG